MIFSREEYSLAVKGSANRRQDRAKPGEAGGDPADQLPGRGGEVWGRESGGTSQEWAAPGLTLESVSPRMTRPSNRAPTTRSSGWPVTAWRSRDAGSALLAITRALGPS